MYTALIIIIIIIFLILIIRLASGSSANVLFFATGIDAGFSPSEINLLWKLSSVAELENPSSLFMSIATIDQSIAQIKQIYSESGIEEPDNIKHLLSSLYEYRTKIELNPRRNKGLKSTKSIAIGQRLYVVLKGDGVFTSQVLNNGRELTVSLPLKKKKVVLASSDWVRKDVSVYFYRFDDASYVFDATVRGTVNFGNTVALFLPHTENILRTQKRAVIRSTCNIRGQIFIQALEIDKIDETSIPGLKCLVEDISEEGALIRIGGKGKTNLKLRLEFKLDEKYIIMTGIVKGVEYNEEKNMSRLHFQCLETDDEARNTILNYVYTTLTQNKDGVANSDENEYNVADDYYVAGDDTASEENLIDSEVLEKKQGVQAMLRMD